MKLLLESAPYLCAFVKTTTPTVPSELRNKMADTILKDFDIDHAQSVAIDAAKLAGALVLKTFHAVKEVEVKDG